MEEFAERVRKNIADSLGVPLTEFTWSDKQELVKRLEEEEKARRQEEQSEYRTSTAIHVSELDLLISINTLGRANMAILWNHYISWELNFR